MLGGIKLIKDGSQIVSHVHKSGDGENKRCYFLM